MNKCLRIGLHFVYATGLLLILVFSGSKYEWITDIDPSIAPSSIEGGSGSRFVFQVSVFAIVVAVQLIIAYNAKKTAEKLISGLLVFGAVLVFSACSL